MSCLLYVSSSYIMSCHLMLHHALCLVPWWIIRNWTKMMMFSLANQIWSRNQIWFVLRAKSEFVSATFLFLLIFTTVWKFKMFKMFWSWASHLWRYSSQLQLSSCPYCWLVGWSVGLLEKVRENGSKDFLDFLHNDSSVKLMTSSRARFSKKNVGAEIWGILGVKNDPFWYCSSLSLTILLKISQKIALLKTFRTM